MKVEKIDGKTVFHCGKKHDKPEKAKRVKNNKEAAVPASESTQEVDNNGD